MERMIRMRIKSFCAKAADAADKNQPNQSAGQKSLFRRKRKELAELTKLQSSGEIRVVEYILDHLYKSSDLFLGSQDWVARHTRHSKAAVSRVFRALEEDRLIIRLKNGVWQVSQPLLDLAKRQRR